MPAELKKEPILADDVEPIDLRSIDETAVYRAVIQVGSGDQLEELSGWPLEGSRDVRRQDGNGSPSSTA